MSDERQRPRHRGLIANAMPVPPPKTSIIPLGLHLTAQDEKQALLQLIQELKGELDSLCDEKISPENRILRDYANTAASLIASIIQSDANLDAGIVRISLNLGHITSQLENTDLPELRKQQTETLEKHLEDLRSTDKARRFGQQEGRERIRQLGEELWSEDTQSILRMGQAIQEVQQMLHAEIREARDRCEAPYERYWPTSHDVIREELTKVSPEYASRGGPTPKALKINK